ncbi:MAG: nicotinate-nicotinamide nucleotide adenylyltransferase [Myxococcota bacterium]
MKRVLLFGLSADPPTGEEGHLGLVRWAARRTTYPELGGPIDAMWILPVFRHAYAEKSGQTSFVHRFEMSRLCFEGRNEPVPIVVSDAERELAAARPEERLGTIDLLDHLEARHSGTRFGFLLGADTARDLFLGKWKGGHTLLTRAGWVVVPRVGVSLDPDLGVVWAHDAPALGKVSSTAARRAHSKERLRWLTPEVAAYVERHGLYGPQGAFDSPTGGEG